MRKLSFLPLLLKILFSVVIVLYTNTLCAQTPTISSFTPASGPIGTAVIINGTNFSATPTDNIVWFGAVKATVNTSTVTSLSVIVPAGATYQPITVTVNGLTGYSSLPFNVIFPSIQVINSTSFASKVDFTTGTDPNGIAFGDIDGDGKPDMVVANTNSNTITVYRNNSSSGSITAGSFPFKVNFTIPFSPYSVAIGDIDGDGKQDLVVANRTGFGSVSVFRNTSSTAGVISIDSFAPRLDLPAGDNSTGIAITDIDGDGKPDIIITNFDSNYITIYRNISTSGSITAGSFESRVDIPSEYGLQLIAIGDIDGDGKPDMAIASAANSFVSVYKNNSSPGSITASSFEARVDIITDSHPQGVSLGDIDGDGKPDMVIVNYSNTISVYRNISSIGSITSGSFESKIDLATQGRPMGVSIGDLDGDGKPDIVVTNHDSNSISVFRNITISGSISQGSFAARVDFSTWTAPGSVAIEDIDGDGKPDIAVVNSNSNVISVLRNILPPPIPPPVINSFSPTTGSIGTAVTITGSNFSTSSSNNIVRFGSVQAILTSATPAQLIVTVPPGATFQPISLTVNGFTAFSRIPFNVTFPSSQVIDATTFATKVDFPSISGLRDIAIGDIDGDGKSDLVLTNYDSKAISVYRNTSTVGSVSPGSFATKVDFTTGTNPTTVAIGDIDGDGKPDLAVVNSNSNTVSIFRNTSTSGSISAGSFATRVDFATGTSPYGVAIGDIDGDGKPDLVVANEISNSVSIFRNTSSPGSIEASSLAPRIDFTAGSSPCYVAIGDIDGDGKPDLMVTNYNSNTVSIFKNISTTGSIGVGSFAASVNFITGEGPQSVALGDIDGDGKPDLAIATQRSGSNVVSIFRNNSTSGFIGADSFASKVDFPTGINPQMVAIGDIDGDGKLDLVVTNNSNNATISVFRNISTSGSITISSLTARVDFTTCLNPSGVAIGDIDGDGKPDLIVANWGNNAVSVLRNSISVSVPPVITSFIPTSGSIGATVTINGSKFSTTAADNIVWFGAVKAMVISATSTQLIVTVPAGAVTQPIIISVNGLSVTSANPFNVISSLPNAPVINSFSPASGPIGTTVTITGMNFSTNLADNIVSFGGNQATVTSATVTQLTVMVPNGSGNMPISVSVNGMTANSNNSFNVTSQQGGNNNNSFEFENTVLTLNGDGVNDRLSIKNFEAYGKCNIYVYNSRGALVYSKKDYLNDWDLTINGHLLDTGGYFYVIETELGTFKGSFSILRK